MLYLGRQLRNRLGLRMGAPFHFIATANGLLAVANFIVMEWERRRFLLATVVMLDALLILALFNRIYWEGYFKKKRNMTLVPGLFMHATRLIGLTVAVVLVLEFVFDKRVPGLIAGIGGLGVALGLALRPVISNLIAGLNIHMGKPFKQGDWLFIENRMAEVMELN